MNGYYKEIFDEISELMNHGNKQQALNKIEEELRMPYIPADFENLLINLKKEYLEESESLSKQLLTDEKLESYLFGNENQQLIAATQLASSNLRNYVGLVQRKLKENPHLVIRSLLIESLIDQQIQEEIVIEQDGMEIAFIPACIEMPMECEGTQLCVSLLKEWLENDNPSFLSMCLECLFKESYLLLPQNIETDESESIALAIVEYVYKANHAENDLNCLIKEKALAQNSSYELLLYKHDI